MANIFGGDEEEQNSAIFYDNGIPIINFTF